MPLPLSAKHFTPLLSFVSVSFLSICSNHDLGGWKDDDLIREDLNDNSIKLNCFVEFNCNTFFTKALSSRKRQLSISLSSVSVPHDKPLQHCYTVHNSVIPLDCCLLM